jgi:hypothetical protein
MTRPRKHKWGKKLGRISRRLAPILFALLLLIGSLAPLSNPGVGNIESEQVQEPIEEPLQIGEYLFGPVSGQRYLIVKNMEEGRTYYFGEGLVFHDFNSLVAFEMSLAEGSSYKLDPKLQEAIEKDDPNVIVGIVVEMRDQPSHQISLDVRAEHQASLQALLDEREGIYSAVRAREPSFAYDLKAPLESHMTASEVQHLEEINLKIDYKMYAIRKEIMDITMVENARIQEDLYGELQSRGFRVGYQGHLFNSFSARVPVGYLRTMADRDDVGYVHANFKMYPLLDHSANAIYANVMWSSGITGGPWDLTVADTGIDGSHPNLHEEWEMVVHDNGQFDPRYDDDPASTDDFHGHGTHIAGIILSNDSTYQGVAYGMRDMIDAKFGYDTTDTLGGGDWGDFMEVTDWAIQTAGADILSLSFGGPGFTNGNSGPPRFIDAVIDDLGVPIAVAAGNDGPGAGTVGIPADAFNILAVGSINDGNSDSRVGDILSGFSSRGPLDDGRIKPDVVAPGQNIISANQNWESANDFVTMSGTSMAAPHVAAALLLMMNYTDDPTLFPAVYKALMINHAEGWGATSPNNATGWGYIDMDKTLTWMDYHIEGTVNDGLRYRFYQGSASAGDKATLVWHKHSVYIGASYPFQHWPPNDLDLYVYEMPSRTQLGYSSFALNNVEQLEFDTDRPNIVFKVRAFGDIDGVINEPFSLAVMGSYNEIAPPSYIVNVDAPATVLFGATFDIFANITNVGDLEGWNVNGRLNLPAGLTLMSGPNPSLLGNLPNGSTAMVSWQVRADAVGGQILSVDGYSTSLGETFLNNSGPVIVNVQDVELPLIMNVTALPSPQEVYGFVNISSLVLDNTGVQQVRVTITNPDLSPYGNLSMSYDPGTGRYYYSDSYNELGDYTFDIWAEDINSNWNTSSGLFTIQDTTPPEITSVIAIPSPQEVFGTVNISADVTDNFLLSNVVIEITDPLSAVTNFTMTNGLFDNHFHFDNYNLLGIYDFTIWAVDSLGTWNSSSGQFIIQDSTLPIANAGPDQYDVLIGTVVNFDGSLSSDNYGIASHVWTFIDMTPQTLMGATPQYTFLTASCYDVTLNVTDIAGNYDTDLMRVCTIERNPPLIQNVAETPNPQEIYGFVNVSADVWDDYGLVDVWIEVVAPDMTSTNVSMTPGSGDAFYYRKMYSVLGTYGYTISALDVYDNWNSYIGSFFIDDWTPPEINNLGINPATQQIHGAVNVTGFVTDNHQVDEVLIHITDPDGLTYTNTSMSFFALALQHFYRDFYHKLGTYNFTIWASDFSGNWNSTQGSFFIEDTLYPTFTSVGATPNPQEVFFNVNISSSASDNHMVIGAWVNITDPLGGFVGNYSMNEVIPGEFYLSRSYDSLGLFSYLIWVSDLVGNWNSLGGTFRMIDGTRPEVTALESNPSVEVFSLINLTANATDNYDLVGTWIVVYTPTGSPFGNFSMTENPGVVANYFYQLSFNILGQYSYFVAAKDGSGNWNASWETFNVVDTTPPLADAGDEQIVVQGTNVRLDGRGSSDNFGPIEYHNWTFDYDGDTIELSGSQVTYKFDIPGNYTATLLVVDSSGNTDSDITWVNVTAKDSDGDGLSDDDETGVYSTDPMNPDTDEDGIDDGDEIALGLDPRDNDFDNDGLLDGEDPDPFNPNVDDDLDQPFLSEYWWIILLIILLPVIIIPILAATGRKRKKEDDRRALEKKRRQAAMRKRYVAQKQRLAAPPPPPEEEDLPPPPDEEAPPPPDEIPPPDDELPPPPPGD